MRGLPDKNGHYGEFGGRFVPETLMSALIELERTYKKFRRDRKFQMELRHLLEKYAGRPTPLYFSPSLSRWTKGRVYLKREDLCHTGAHKINNTLGQALLAKRMKKERVIAETGAGQHGVATATVAAMLDLKCTIYMGEEDMERQKLNVFRMKLLGAEVLPVSSGSRTLKDAMNEAIRDWVTNVRTTHYIIGSVAGPHPYPMIVRDFQSVIGKEAKRQIFQAEGRLPDYLIACIGGGSNAMGLFHPFLNCRGVHLIGVEAGGLGISSGRHGASLTAGEKGVLHGSLTFVLQNGDGQIRTAHSISAGLDYPGVGPEVAYLKETGRIEVHTAEDKEAVEAFRFLSREEGIIPALEPAHAIAYLLRERERFKRKVVILNLSGRGDKDVEIVNRYLKDGF